MPSYFLNPFCNPSFGFPPNDPLLYLERGEPCGAGEEEIVLEIADVEMSFRHRNAGGTGAKKCRV